MALGFVSVGAILQCTAFGVPQMMIGRFITGLGVGIDSSTGTLVVFVLAKSADESTVPMYQAELCRPDVRGRLVTLEVLFIALGITLAYFIDFGLSFISGPVAWRIPIVLQIPMALAVSIVLIGLPETPRWLWQHDRIDEAIDVMVKVYDIDETDPYITQEKTEIVKAIEIERANSFKWSRLFQRDALQTGWRIWLAVLIMFMNQVCESSLSYQSVDQSQVEWHQCHRLLYLTCPRDQRWPKPQHSHRCWGLYQLGLCRWVTGSCPGS